MTPESARIRKIIDETYRTFGSHAWMAEREEALECLDALEARLETAERERAQVAQLLKVIADAGGIEHTQRRDIEALQWYVNQLIERAEAAERRAEQLTQALRALTEESARAVTEPRRFHENEGRRQQRLSTRVATARKLLASAEGAGDE